MGERSGIFSGDIYPTLNHTKGQDDPPPDDLAALALSPHPAVLFNSKPLSLGFLPPWSEHTMRNEILASFSVICGL